MTSSELDFMLILGNLKRNKRTGWVIRNVPHPESISDHMYRMAIMAMLLDGNQANSELDKTRCVKIALVHDMCEAIVGDITPHCGVPVDEKHRMEKQAMVDMCANLTASVRDEIMELYEEYEKQESKEAQAVKDLDRFELILQAFEYETLESREDNTKYLEDIFQWAEGKFRNPQVREWVNHLVDLRRNFHQSIGDTIGCAVDYGTKIEIANAPVDVKQNVTNANENVLTESGGCDQAKSIDLPDHSMTETGPALN